MNRSLKSAIRNVIFDFGNVLVDWDPFGALHTLFNNRSEMDECLSEIEFFEWNKEQDRGRSWEDGLAWAADRHPERVGVFETYLQNMQAAHAKQIEGMADLVHGLRSRGVLLFGLTNASERAYQCVLSTCPFISDFQDTLVSAREGLVKPDPKIFKTLLARNSIIADETLFVDDIELNCLGAKSVGLQTHVFVGADDLSNVVLRGSRN